MNRRILRAALAGALLLQLPLSSSARDLPDAHRFQQVHAATAVPGVLGSLVEGAALRLEDGQLVLTVRRLVLGDGLAAEKVKVRAPLAIDGAFLAAPVSGMVQAFLAESDIEIGGFDTRGPFMNARDVRVEVRDGRFQMRAKKVVTLRAEGRATLDRASMALAVTVERAKAGVLPVPLGPVFAVMARVLRFPNLVVDRPEIRLDILPFLR